MKKGKLLVISGPSGVGKDTIVHMFLEKHPNWHRPPSVTTRQSRAGEVEGLDYIFTDRPTFEKRVKAGEFLEWFEVTGNLYGTLRQPVERLLEEGKNVILRKEVNGALNIKKELSEAVTIFLALDNFGELHQRIQSRATDSQELIGQRLKLAKDELTYKKDFDHIIINPYNHPEKALAAVERTVGL